MSLSILGSVGCSDHLFNRVSRKITKSFVVNNPNERIVVRSFDAIRRKLYSQGRLNFINTKSDTFFVMQIKSSDGGYPGGTIWNAKNVVSYLDDSSYSGEIHSVDEFIYSKNVVETVSKWDTAYFRNQEFNARSLHSSLIYVSRIVIDNGKIYVNSLIFKDYGIFD